MTVGKLLDDVRDRYLTQYRQRIAEVGEVGMQAVAEPAYLQDDGALARDGVLSLPTRLDLVGILEDDAVERISVDSESMVSFEPIDFDWPGPLAVRITPFYWDACDIRAEGIAKDVDWSRVRDWFDRWFDGEDKRPADEQGFHGVIHFLSDPHYDGSKTTFQVDFGTAPEEAFEELLDALRGLGATRIEIGNGFLA